MLPPFTPKEVLMREDKDDYLEAGLSDVATVVKKKTARVVVLKSKPVKM
jgi:hypothetical protein